MQPLPSPTVTVSALSWGSCQTTVLFLEMKNEPWDPWIGTKLLRGNEGQYLVVRGFVSLFARDFILRGVES